MNFFVLQFLKRVLRKRVVMAVDESGENFARVVRFTDSGKAFVRIEGNRVGFLDNPIQKVGEFRRNISAPGLTRWFNL